MPTKLVFNGVDVETGAYATPPMSFDDIAAIAMSSIQSGELSNKRTLKSLQQRKTLDGQKGHLGPIEGIDPKDLGQAGWGVIFANDADPLLIESLRPLLDLRKAQAQKIKPGRYQELTGDKGYFAGDTKWSFLDNHNAGGGGPADPDQLPYYLLIVGSPDAIPWSFQYQLDVQYGVGRLFFDTGADYTPYTRYAQSVVQAESGAVALARTATFIGTAHKDDDATQLSASELIAPLSKLIADDQPTWTINTIPPDQATYAAMSELLGGSKTPAILFTATHGALCKPTNPKQKALMGGLITADWAGPTSKDPLPPTYCFSGDSLSPDAQLAGLISFHFACFGAGTPHTDDFTAPGATEPALVADKAFAAYLPQCLLSHPNGGSLAAIGHIDRAWGYAFKSENGDVQLRSFKDVLKRLMEGHPVGSAMEPFNQRYAELSSDLSNAIFTKPDPDEMAFMWTNNNDARNYVVIGDPAVRLQLTDDPAKQKRATLTPSPKPVTTTSGNVQYGFFSDATAALQDITAKITAKLSQAIDSMATVEVSTYTTSDMAAAKANQMQGATLRAYSRVRLDGNAEICVPETNGQVDEALWKIHSDMVQKALDNRTATLKAIASAIGSLRIP